MGMYLMLLQSNATRCLDLIKMKPLMPCTVDDRVNKFKCTIKEVVFDPSRVEDVNKQFVASGYNLREDFDFKVIAVNDDDSILCWGGLNSVYHLKKGETIGGGFDNLAFNDIVHLTEKFNIKNTKTEIKAMIAKLRENVKLHNKFF